jgi:hypothetical protein
VRGVHRYFVLGLALLVLSCASGKVANNYDRNAPFKDYGTYSWVTEPVQVTGPGTQASIAWAKQRNNFVGTKVLAAFDEQLAAKGFSKAADGADLHAFYHIGSGDILKVSDWGYDYAAFFGAWEGSDAENPEFQRFKTGDLVLDLVSVDTGRLVWRGSAARVLTKDADPQVVEASIAEAAAQILESYPPEPRKRY